MASKVCSCGTVLSYGARQCPNCSEKVRIEGAKYQGLKSFIDRCEKCGSPKGRLIEEKENGKTVKSFYQCYDCWNSLSSIEARGFFVGEKNRALGAPEESKHWAKEEAQHQRNLQEYFLKPKFYNEPINIPEIEKSGRKINGAKESWLD